MRIEALPITPPVFLATITKALGIDVAKMIVSNTGRPPPIAKDSVRPIAELLN